MEYKIKKGDKFLCLEDYIMDDDRVAYTQGKVYKSELDNRITDNDFDIMHEMQGQDDFFEYFKFLPSDTVAQHLAQRFVALFQQRKSKKPTFSYAKNSQIHTNFRLNTKTAIE